MASYYNSLIQFLDHVLAEQFVKPHHRAMLMVEENPDALIERYLNYQPLAVKHWIDKEET